MRVGVLALQGAFIEHEQMLQHIGVEAFEGCTNLQKPRLPYSVRDIGQNAFLGCRI